MNVLDNNRSDAIRDAAILVARLGVGVIFVAHGWQKIAVTGHSAVAESFAGMGVPLAGLSAWFAMIVELVGGAAMILGLGVPIAGLLLAVDMAGAFLFVHSGNGIFVSDGGFELVLALGVLALLLAANGSGRFGVDALLRAAVRKGQTTRDQDVAHT